MFRKKPADFTRNRTLTLEHTIGLVIAMVAARNGNGYDISSQNYFRELGAHLATDVDPARRQAVTEARGKLGWQAFEYLLECANLETEGLPASLMFKGHVTRAVDGSSFYSPRADDLLMHFSPRNTCSEEGETHYPYGMMVTAVNVYTGQPVRAVVDSYNASERAMMKSMIGGFSPGDLSLLDRGIGGAQVYLEFERHGQYFIHRSKTTGERLAGYVREFLDGKKKQKTVSVMVKDEESGAEFTLELRMIRGPDDSEGKPIVLVTNLLDKKHYPRSQLLALYRKRWTVETLYGRVKHLLCLENFHGRTHNGVMQEIFANLLILSLTAIAVTTVVKEDGVDAELELPSFKNAAEVVRRHLFALVDHRIEGIKPKKLMKRILAEVRAIMYPIRPGRSYPRVSMQPIKSWNLKKSAKLRAFDKQRTAAGPLAANGAGR